MAASKSIKQSTCMRLVDLVFMAKRKASSIVKQYRIEANNRKRIMVDRNFHTNL
jgi:hypothetical protein